MCCGIQLQLKHMRYGKDSGIGTGVQAINELGPSTA